MVRRIGQLGLVIALSAIAAWAQAETATAQPANANPCVPTQPPQQMAAATPPRSVTPVGPELKGPQFPAPYQRLHKSDKFKLFLRYTYSPYTFAGAAFDAGTAQATGGWYSYGGGMEGYGKRYGAALADTESSALFGRFLFPVLLHEDPRYLRSNSDKTMPRVGYALSRVLVTHDDNGKKRPNLSLMFSAVASSSLANSYYPRENRGFGDTMARAGGGLLSTGEMNLLREFWPDISKKLRKHEPKRIQRLEENPRVSKIEDALMGPVAPSPCPPAPSPPAPPDPH
jgi:hypothetical protein